MSKQKKKRVQPVMPDDVRNVYEVSYETRVEPALLNLPADIQKELESLYDKLIRNPQQTLPRLLALRQLYPKVMLLNNYLAVAYGFIDREKQKQCIEENYRKHPKYLFARCHYAQLCLDEGKPEKIPAIFEHKLDLKAQYPRRKRFHISEYLAFMQVLCLYLHACGETEQAETVYNNMRQADPDCEEVRQVKKVLFPGFIQRTVAKIKSCVT